MDHLPVDSVITVYLELSAAVLILWDSIIVIPKELQLLSRDGWTRTYAIYIGNRYITCVALFIFFRLLSPSPNLSVAKYVAKDLHRLYCLNQTYFRCRASVIAFLTLHLLSFAVLDALLVRRCYIFWDRRKFVSKALVICYAISYTCTAIFVALYARQLFDDLDVSDPGELALCVIQVKPSWNKGLWLSNVSLDLCMIVLMLLNSLDRPRHSRDGLLKSLVNDGIVVLVIISSLRIVNLVMSITAQPSLTLISVPIVWSIITVLVSRLILRLLWTDGSKARASKLQATIEYEVEYYREPSYLETEENIQHMDSEAGHENISMSMLAERE